MSLSSQGSRSRLTSRGLCEANGDLLKGFSVKAVSWPISGVDTQADLSLGTGVWEAMAWDPRDTRGLQRKENRIDRRLTVTGWEVQ